eukprot:8534128-Alexandrium_andersonii.AAC.1
MPRGATGRLVPSGAPYVGVAGSASKNSGIRPCAAVGAKAPQDGQGLGPELHELGGAEVRGRGRCLKQRAALGEAPG